MDMMSSIVPPTPELETGEPEDAEEGAETEMLCRILEGISRVEGMLLMLNSRPSTPTQDVIAFPQNNPFDQIDLF